MNSDNVSEFPAEQHVIPAVIPETRPLYWSIRRELWENRSIYLAPLIVAAVVLFGSFIATASAPSRYNDPVKERYGIMRPMKMAPAPIMLASFFIGLFYCLDSLYGERRDRSILFWKSMPVSDTTAVLAKAAIPFLILPAIVLALSFLLKMVLMVLAAGVLSSAGHGIDPLVEYPHFQSLVVMVYGYYAHVLWYAPLYGWLMLVSAASRRVPALWAVLPLLAIAAFEMILFQTTSFLRMLRYRMGGAMKEAFAPHARDGNVKTLSDLDPVNFFTTPGLWLGLMFAVAFVIGAARLRRKHQLA